MSTDLALRPGWPKTLFGYLSEFVGELLLIPSRLPSPY